MTYWESVGAIDALYDKTAKEVCGEYGLTRMEFMVLMFFADNPHANTAADVVRLRMVSKSHVSLAVRSLEEQGLLKRLSSTEDRRLIRLTLTEKARPIVEAGQRAHRRFLKQLLTGFTPQERKQCDETLRRLSENAQAVL